MHNYHTHTTFCDGSNAPADYADAALEAGMKTLGFSAHAPLPFETEWTLRHENVSSYISEINRLKQDFKGRLDIRHGLEADYIPAVSTPFETLKQTFGLDYIIGSVHLVKGENDAIWFIDGPEENFINGLRDIFGNNARKAVSAFYMQTMEMIATQKPDIIGHIDKVKMYNRNRFFNENDAWYRNLIEETLCAAAHAGCIIEVNTRGVYTGKTNEFFPSDHILRACKRLQIPLMINSDAHNPTQLTSQYGRAREQLAGMGFTHLAVPETSGLKYIEIENY